MTLEISFSWKTNVPRGKNSRSEEWYLERNVVEATLSSVFQQIIIFLTWLEIFLEFYQIDFYWTRWNLINRLKLVKTKSLLQVDRFSDIQSIDNSIIILDIFPVSIRPLHQKFVSDLCMYKMNISMYIRFILKKILRCLVERVEWSVPGTVDPRSERYVRQTEWKDRGR